MATRLFQVNFGSLKTGLTTVGYQLLTSTGANQGSRITAGVFEIGGGSYAAVVTLPADTFVGAIKWDSGEGSPLYAVEPINPAALASTQNFNNTGQTTNLPADVQTIKTQAVTAAAGVTFLASVGTATTSTAQTGDSFSRIGAAGAGLTSVVLATPPPTTTQINTAVWTNLLSSSDFSTVASIGALLKAFAGVTTETITVTGTSTTSGNNTIFTCTGLAAPAADYLVKPMTVYWQTGANKGGFPILAITKSGSTYTITTASPSTLPVATETAVLG